MKIIYSIADLQPESGGPSRSVSALANAVAELGNQVEVIALEYGCGNNAPMMPPQPVQTTLVPCRGLLARKFKRSPGFEAVLRNCFADGSDGEGPLSEGTGRKSGGRATVLHDNGLWLPTNHAAAQIARKLGIPLVISPRGMLTSWALRFRGLKKRLAWRLYQHRDLQSAQVLHATSQQEAEGFRALGLMQPIAVIPNGVQLSPYVVEPSTLNPQPKTRTLLFLGRIHPVKGLLELVEAWAAVNRKSEIGNRKSVGWQVVIAGGNENGHMEEVKTEIRKQKLESSFKFIGEVANEAKWKIYRNADLFVMPSRTENFGIAIAEALACGVPVITTRGTPWEDLIRHRCGWWIEIGAKPLAEALKEAMGLTDEERRAMGLRGRKLVEENYTWAVAAKKMTAVYEWMISGAGKPDCIVQ